MRILYPENPRFPLEGSSAEGKSGPKARLKSVVDGKRVIIPVPPYRSDGGTQQVSSAADWKWRSKSVGDSIGKSVDVS